MLGFLLVMVCEDSQAREKQQQDDQDNADADIEGGVVSLIILNVRGHQLQLPSPCDSSICSTRLRSISLRHNT